MDAVQAAYSVAILIGVGVVGWLTDRVVAHGETIAAHSERIAALETARCTCHENTQETNDDLRS